MRIVQVFLWAPCLPLKTNVLTVLAADPPVPAGDFGAALVLPVLRVHDVSEQAERNGDRGPLLGGDSRQVAGWVGQLVEVSHPAGDDQVSLRSCARIDLGGIIGVRSRNSF